jgi:hypothetical protein
MMLLGCARTIDRPSLPPFGTGVQMSPFGGRISPTLSAGGSAVAGLPVAPAGTAHVARRKRVGCYDSTMNRTLILAGLALLFAGLFWSKLRALPLFRLPGDIMIDRPGFKFFFPVTTLLLASVVLSIVLWLMRR